MKTFNKAVGLRMKCRGVNVSDIEERSEVSPNRGSELWTSVGGESVRKAET
jgi:hypothetical protein